MKGKRLFITLRLWTILDPNRRTQYLKYKNVFANLGTNTMIMDRTLPLYPSLIKIGDNVQIASNVHFVTHDVIHVMLNRLPNIENASAGGGIHLQEKLGCIEIGNNVFIGSGSRILYDTRIGSNCIIGANTLINKDIPDNSIVAGTPAKLIGDFDEYVKKRIMQSGYPDNLRPKNEEIKQELSDFLWQEFYNEREK